MPTFRYSAYKTGGSEVSGTIDASSLNEAKQRLKNDGLYPKEIAPADEAGSPKGLQLFRSKVGLPELSLVTRRLARRAPRSSTYTSHRRQGRIRVPGLTMRHWPTRPGTYCIART